MALEIETQTKEIKTTIQEVDSSKDKVFNDKLYHKLYSANSYFLYEGWICAIISLFLFVIFLIQIVVGVKPNSNFFGETQNEKVIGIILWFAIEIVFVAVFIYAINYIIKYYLLKNDFANKRTKIVNMKPKRVRLIYGRRGKYNSTCYIDFLKLYYDGFSLLIPFEFTPILKHRERLSICYKRCMKLNKKITYFEKSKIVIFGAEEYKKIVIQELVD